MSGSFRSGNSRLLVKHFDQLGLPLAVLDRRGTILFANLALCELVHADATKLVGLQSSWQVAEDDSPFAALRTALAAPAGALQGKFVVRQLATPIVFGSTHSAQLFVPLLDADGTVHATVVVLGEWSSLQTQIPVGESPNLPRRKMYEQALVQIRSKWETTDHFHPLLGVSPTIELAMTRIQMVLAHPCNVLISAPPGSAVQEVIRGMFAARLKQCGAPKTGGHFLPVDCQLVDSELLNSMLEIMAARLRPTAPREAQLLVLENVDHLSADGVALLLEWLERYGALCFTASSASSRLEEICSRGDAWQQLLARLAQLDIAIPPLKERRADVATLAQHLLAVQCRRHDRAILTFTPEAAELLTAYPWPGNYSQLAEAIKEAVDHAVLTSVIQPSHLPVSVRTFPSTVEQAGGPSIAPIELDAVLQDVERILLTRAMQLSPRNRAAAARLLGISRPRLLRRINQLGIDHASSDPEEEDGDDL